MTSAISDLSTRNLQSDGPKPVASSKDRPLHVCGPKRVEASHRIGVAFAPPLLAVGMCALYKAAGIAGFFQHGNWIFQFAVVAALGLVSGISSLGFVQAILRRTHLHSSEYRQIEADLMSLTVAIEQASEAIVITDATGNIQHINPSFTALTGYSKSEAIGKNPRLIQSGRQNQQFYKDLWDTILAGKRWHGEPVNRRKDGTLYVEEMAITPVCSPDGAISRFVAIKSDATSRKGAQDAQAALGCIVESSEDAILSASPDGRIASWNRGAETLYGYTAQEILGQSLSILLLSENHEPLKHNLALLLRGESIPAFDSVVITKDGKHVEASIRAFPIRNGTGQVVGTGAIVRDISVRKQAEQAQGMLASIVESSSVGIFSNALDGTFLTWNKGAEAIWGYRPEEVIGRSIDILGQPERHKEQARVLGRCLRGESCEFESPTVRADGVVIDTAMTVSAARNCTGEVVAISTIARDISAHKQAEEALRQGEEKYRSLVANIPDTIWTSDSHGDPTFVSPSCERVCGYTPDEICRPGVWQALIHPEDLSGYRAAREILSVPAQPSGERPRHDQEFRIRRKDGRWIWVHSKATGAYEKLGKTYVDGVLSDVTERKDLQHKLAHQATHDALTGLPNRQAFEARFQRALDLASIQNERLALLYLDLDGFKLINDTVGHLSGDHLLLQTAQRLSGCLREGDILARSGGDEFMFVLTEMHDPQAAPRIAERLLGALSPAFHAGGKEIFIHASIGIALYPEDGQDLLGLQRSADEAMLDAKRRGKNRFQTFTPALGEAAGRRVAIETELHHALERREFSLQFQPKINLETGAIAGVEALLRWFNPNLGTVRPSEFIVIAEETGLILPISKWVLWEACRHARSWCETGCGRLPISVNVSAVQLTDGTFPALVARALAEIGLESSLLDLEVTESAIMYNIEESTRQLADLKQLGVSISLDDFGTGYSSLNYLARFPIDILKIDQSFVRRMGETKRTTTLVQAIVALAHALGMKVVAEGVESEHELGALKAMNCDFGQGFLLAHPVPSEFIAQMLATKSRHFIRPERSAPLDSSLPGPGNSPVHPDEGIELFVN